MRGVATSRTVRALAAALVFFQTLLPGTMGVAQASGADVAGILCLTPASAPSDDARRYVRMLAELLGEEVPADTAQAADCPLCVLAKEKVAVPTLERVLPAPVSIEASYVTYESAFVVRCGGPRLGGRAPPISI